MPIVPWYCQFNPKHTEGEICNYDLKVNKKTLFRIGHWRWLKIKTVFSRLVFAPLVWPVALDAVLLEAVNLQHQVQKQMQFLVNYAYFFLTSSQIPAVWTQGLWDSTSATMARLIRTLVSAAQITTQAQLRSTVSLLRTRQPLQIGIKWKVHIKVKERKRKKPFDFRYCMRHNISLSEPCGRTAATVRLFIWQKY